MNGSLALVGSGEYLPAMTAFEKSLLEDGICIGFRMDLPLLAVGICIGFIVDLSLLADGTFIGLEDVIYGLKRSHGLKWSHGHEHI